MKPSTTHRTTLTATLLFLGLWTLDFGLWTSQSPASIITGNIQNTSGNAYVTNALFAPLSHEHHRLDSDERARDCQRQLFCHPQARRLPRNLGKSAARLVHYLRAG